MDTIQQAHDMHAGPHGDADAGARRSLLQDNTLPGNTANDVNAAQIASLNAAQMADTSSAGAASGELAYDNIWGLRP